MGGNGRPKKSRGTSCRFCPTGSDFPVGPELWQEVWPTDLGRWTDPPLGPRAGWRTDILVHGARTRSVTFRHHWVPDRIAKIPARSHCPNRRPRLVGQKSNPYRDHPREIYIFETPTARTVPKILVARMTQLRRPGGRKKGGPKKSRGTSCRFCPTRVELVGRTGTLAGSSAVGGRRSAVGLTHHWGSADRNAKFPARSHCPGPRPPMVGQKSNPYRTFRGKFTFSKRRPRAPSQKFWSRKMPRARTVPSVTGGQSAKRVTSIGRSRGKNHIFRNADRAHCLRNFGRADGSAERVAPRK